MLNHGEYWEVPERTLSAIDRWVVYGVQPGGFVRAVLTNNLRTACGYADLENSGVLCEIVKYCVNEIPSYCWGTEEIVNNYKGNEEFAVFLEENGR